MRGTNTGAVGTDDGPAAAALVDARRRVRGRAGGLWRMIAPRLSRYSFAGCIEYVVWHGLRGLPTLIVSMIGWSVGVAHCAVYSVSRADWLAEIRDALSRISGDTDRSSLQRRAYRYFGNLGQVMFESAVLERFVDNGRIDVIGAEHAVDAARPTIFVGTHLSNWELVAVVAAKLGIQGNILYWPPNNQVRRDVASKVRDGIIARIPNTRMIASTPHAMRRLATALSHGENLLIFVDEQKDGLIWAPRLGRELPEQGNRMLVARLAVKHNARVVPVFVRRSATARYECVIEPALERPAEADAATATRHLSDAIDARVEHWVRGHPEQWFWIGELIRTRGHLAKGPRRGRPA
jgi:KDO2-lipid IV(A) lauroyltransferase